MKGLTGTVAAVADSGMDRRHMLRVGLLGLVSTGAGGLLAACGGGDGHGMEPKAATPRLSSVLNFRDVAGADDASAYHNTAGQPLKRGVFYRSNVMLLSDDDAATLAKLGITTAYDLRTTNEASQDPDRLPQGIRYVHMNIFGTPDVVIPPFHTPEETVAAMEEMGRVMVRDAGMRERMGELLRSMASTADAQLFHCTTGKDRTGWVTALLHTIAGVSRDIIMKDYLLTNTYTGGWIEATYQQMLEHNGKAAADLYRPLFGVQQSYLLAEFDEAERGFGSMKNYLTQGLGLKDDEIAQLRDKLLG
ncbi:MAG: tyrosine-protein phosphatase [Comamonas sp.]|jgi:protein-tyrosine phosphatase|nr:tyrosine-protein phosphatase [Comamonas sp.]